MTSAVSNGIGWEPRNDSSVTNGDNREHQRPVMGHIHQTLADNKHQSDNGVTSTEDGGFNHKYLNNNANGIAVHIDIPNNVNLPPPNDKIRIPQEKFKTFVGKYQDIFKLLTQIMYLSFFFYIYSINIVDCEFFNHHYIIGCCP